MTPEKIIELLELKPHPEGGWYHETYRSADSAAVRGAATAIYYLLRDGERSHWHRVRDADEVWNLYAGAPLRLSLSRDGVAREAIDLGPDLAGGERPQAVVPKDVWQAAVSLGDWSLVGCIVAPAFRFEGFELAPTDWEPGRG